MAAGCAPDREVNKFSDRNSFRGRRLLQNMMVREAAEEGKRHQMLICCGAGVPSFDPARHRGRRSRYGSRWGGARNVT
jgi:hypothetical protein